MCSIKVNVGAAHARPLHLWVLTVGVSGLWIYSYSFRLPALSLEFL